MMKIKAKKIKPIEIEHFSPDGKSLGFLNEYEDVDLRCQIAEKKAQGYYLLFKEKKIRIKPDGSIFGWQQGMYDDNEKLISRLFTAQRKQNESKNN